MKHWEPVVALPNVDVVDAVDSRFVAIVGRNDQRVQTLEELHPVLRKFLSRFTNEFDVAVKPIVLLIRRDAPESVFAIDAIASFRDIVSMSAIP